MSPAPANRPALETAFAEHYAFVRERLRGLGVAAADLDDATQDVFEVLVRRIADYDPQRPMRAWMAGMARKVARRYRDRGRRGIVALDERRAASEESPEDRAARAEAWAVLQRFVDELEPERWAVFVLSEIEGLRGSEIAAELGVNLNTVYARLRSARVAFERTLRRHRARERRFVWLPPRRWVLWGGLTLSGGVTIGAIVVSCEDDEQPIESRAESPAQRSAAARPSEPTSVRTLAPDTTPATIEEPWIDGGSGFSMGRNAEGERYTLSTETRHRLDGDRVILEITYIGDEDANVDDAGHQLALDGLEIVDGASEWQTTIPA
ncbi:MAG TPA: sigma-70 family RNA polymerase sigma factor, partial [Enhygromyxa sp.]|nr:sigma-70 family RNA polymerase sigma factor [Enhygromyxa sp.]